MVRDPLIAIADILKELAFLDSVVRDHSFDAFLVDPVVYRASAYALLVVSEASRHIPAEWLEPFPEIRWRAMRAAGNRIRHEYFNLQASILWNIMTVDCIALKATLLQIRAQHQAG